MTAFRFFTVLSLAAVLNFEGLAAPGFTMRLDDNRSPEQWNRIAGIFERQGMRCSFAVIPATLSEAQGACLNAVFLNSFSGDRPQKDCAKMSFRGGFTAVIA